MKVGLTNNTNLFVHEGDKRYNDLPDPSKCTPSEYMEKTAEFAEAEYTQLRASNRDIAGNKILVHEGEPEYDEMPDPTGPEDEFKKYFFSVEPSSKAEKQQGSVEKNAKTVHTEITQNVPEQSPQIPAKKQREPVSQIITEEKSVQAVESTNFYEKAYGLSQLFLGENILKIVCGSIYVYSENYYRLLTSDELESLIDDFIIAKLGFSASNYVTEIFKQIRRNSKLKSTEMPSSDIIACENGWIDCRLQFMQPTPLKFVIHKVKAHYDNRLTGKCPLMNAIIEAQARGSEALEKRLWQALALIFCNLDVKKFIVFYGVGDSGKSTVIEILTTFFDDLDIFPIKPTQMADKFVLNEASGKKLAFCGELNKAVLSDSEVATIKAITGGDMLNAQGKFKDPHKLITTGGLRLIYGTNHLILPATPDEAFHNRLLMLPFTVAIPKASQNPNLKREIASEMDAIFTTALQYLPELIANNFTFAGEEETTEAIAKYQKYANRSVSDLAFDFFDSALVIEENCFTKTEDIRQTFSEVCDVCIDASAFGKLLRAYLLSFPNVQEARLPNSKGKARGYRGIKLANYSSDIII